MKRESVWKHVHPGRPREESEVMREDRNMELSSRGEAGSVMEG